MNLRRQEEKRVEKVMRSAPRAPPCDEIPYKKYIIFHSTQFDQNLCINLMYRILNTRVSEDMKLLF